MRRVLWSIRQLWRHFAGVLRGPNRVLVDRLIKEGRVEIAKSTYDYCVPHIKAFVHSTAKVVIHPYSSLTDSSMIFVGGMHPVDAVTTYPHRILWNMEGQGTDDFPTQIGDGEIGADVWLGDRAIVMPGLRIGHGAVVGANSVVTKDVPDYAIVAGSPAQVLRYRFPKEQVAGLLETQWWTWPESEIREAVPLLAGKDIDAFIAYARARNREH